MFNVFHKNNSQEVALTVTTQTFIRVLLLIVGSIVILGALSKASHALLLIFTAFFLALALNAPVHAIAKRLPGKRKGSRAWATSISFLLVVIVLIAFISSLIPPLIRQGENFINTAPEFIRDIRDRDGEVGRFVQRYHLEGQLNEFSGQLQDRLKNASGAAVATVTKVGSSIFSVLTILVLTFMMLVEGPRWISFFRRLVREDRRARADRIAYDMYRVIKGYVNGQVLLAAIAAAFILPALLLLHISFPIALVGIVFICGLIPMFGHTIGAVIVTLVALFHSPLSAIIILGYYILYQQIENYLIQPRVQANTTNMSPLLVFASVVVGVSFGGLFGGLVAIPVAGCLRIALLDYLNSQDILRKQQDKELASKAGTK